MLLWTRSLLTIVLTALSCDSKILSQIIQVQLWNILYEKFMISSRLIMKSPANASWTTYECRQRIIASSSNLVRLWSFFLQLMSPAWLQISWKRLRMKMQAWRESAKPWWRRQKIWRPARWFLLSQEWITLFEMLSGQRLGVGRADGFWKMK